MSDFDTFIHDGNEFKQIGTKSGDCGRAGPEPRWFILGKVCGGNTLLLGTVRFTRGKLRRGERGKARGRAAVAVQGDPECAGCWGPIEEWRGEVP